MKKKHQKNLSRWLNQQSLSSNRWLNISYLLGVASSLLIVIQSWILAYVLHRVVVDVVPFQDLFFPFMVLSLIVVLRSCIVWFREWIGFCVGKNIRYRIRRQLLDKLEAIGPSWIQGRPTGSWGTLILEHVEDIHDYYARYLPQMVLAICAPVLILISIFFTNWASALILFFTAPLIPIFMSLVGMGAADANRHNFLVLSRLSSHFLDRLRGMETLRVFGRGKAEIKNIRLISQNFRKRTMEVLRIAFLSSGVLEFFTSLSIALLAVYFGFSYLGALNFGYYGTSITLFSGFLTLLLAPEFFQPLRDLGTFYHAKARALGAADTLKTFLETPLGNSAAGDILLKEKEPLTLVAEDFSVLSPSGEILVGPLNFTVLPGERIVLVGATGSGKSSLLHALCGFMVYNGSLRINGIELRTLELHSWRKKLSWVGQNPHLLAASLRENVLLGRPDSYETELQLVLARTRVSEFLPVLPKGIDTVLGEQGVGLSVGQAQRIALARALLHPCYLLLLDEPTSSLDVRSEKYVMQALREASSRQTTLMATHHLEAISDTDRIWVMDHGRIVEQGDLATLSSRRGNFFNLLFNRKEGI